MTRMKAKGHMVVKLVLDWCKIKSNDKNESLWSHGLFTGPGLI